jgi:hypothetical protein
VTRSEQCLKESLLGKYNKVLKLCTEWIECLGSGCVDNGDESKELSNGVSVAGFEHMDLVESLRTGSWICI